MPLLEHFPLSLFQYIYLFRINLPIRHTYTEKISMLSGRLTNFLCFYWLKMEAFVHGWGGVALIHYISWKCRKPMTMLIGISVVLVLKSKLGAVFFIWWMLPSGLLRSKGSSQEDPHSPFFKCWLWRHSLEHQRKWKLEASHI